MNPQDLGMKMPVQTHSDVFPVFTVGMGDSPKARQDQNKAPKYAPNGEPTYGSGTILRQVTKDGTIRNDKSASVHVTKPASIYELGQVYEAKGAVWVQPYESNGRVALSITVEQLVPVKASPAAGSKDAA